MAKTNRNPLDEKIKSKVVSTLLPLVYTSLDLRNQVKLAHWNLVGPNFVSVHRFLDEVGETVDEGIDEIAERTRQLGGIIDSSLAIVSKESSLKAFPSGLVSVEKAGTALVDALSKVIDDLHQAIDETDEAGDAITADLLTSVSGKLEVHLWFLESTLS